jgi:pimeloyl-ACP methyl ester carboxylesterase/uncharacterized membrane protein YhhN
MEKNKIPQLFFIIMMLEILAEIYVETLGPVPIYLTKTLLMPVLMYYYYQNTKSNFQTFDKIVLGALFFSWWGDNFLMPSHSVQGESINFLAGLGSFLIAHLLYIPAFLKTTQPSKAVLLRRPWLAFPIVVMVFGLISFLMNQAHPAFMEMKIPVIVYATVIMVMVLTAINRYDRVPHASFKWVTIGALLFMVSDSLIAVSRFSDLFEGNINIARVLIMALYASGQFLIAKGCIEQYPRESKKKIKFKNREFETIEDYFRFMIDELGFPDIIHFFESDSVASGGLNLNVDVHEVDKNAPTVVFVPGTSVYGLCYAEILYEIGKHGYNVVAIDPRGHGRSEGPRGDYTIEELMDDVENVIAYAKNRFNDRVTLMGSSQGGIVSFYLASKGIQVDSVVCQNFADLAWKETFNIARFPVLARMSTPLIKLAGILLPGVTVSTLTYLDLKRIKIKYFGNLHNFIVNDPFTISKISLRAARSLVNAEMPNPIESIKVPIFVFQGSDDIVFPVKYTEKIFERLTCQKQMKVYPGCDHAIMVENVELITPDILDWLDRLYKPV